MDIVAADIRVTALASRSLSATSAGSGAASTEAKRSMVTRKVVKRKGKNILTGCQKDGKNGWVAGERKDATIAAKRDYVDLSILVKWWC